MATNIVAWRNSGIGEIGTTIKRVARDLGMAIEPVEPEQSLEQIESRSYGHRR